jgi:hypothetical protein
MNNKNIIISILGMLFVSFMFLSVLELRQGDINSKNIWMLYFADPKNSSLDFAIENHSDITNFHWEISSDKTVVQENDAVIAKGETKTIPVSISDTANKKIVITVTADNGKKDIYKNF